ncbi:MAG: NAD(P)-dependent oxidoreductase [Chitinophagales bacterium]|nr:NAD(P)-dependent oxidoreductase [Chitinophagales bacterium]
MKILFTGASSFSGYWFVKALAEHGHEVTCVFTAKDIEEYSGIRKERVQQVSNIAKSVFGIKFGDEAFLKLIEVGKFALCCHHAAWVQNYKDFDFDVALAVKNNTNNVVQTLKTLVNCGCKKIIVTGSVFEGGEGEGSDGLPHFSPYGLSKALTSQVFEYYSMHFKMTFGKFVIPNPFGEYEEPRFTSYLMNNWLKGQTPKVNTPDYVRDNIPVGLLASYYHYFCEKIQALETGSIKLAPSGIVGSQGAFTQLVAREAGSRLGKPCDCILEHQTNFSEPLIRINTDRITELEKAFSERKFWDEFVAFYKPK